MKALMVTLALLAMASTAMADTLSWEPPTVREDGTPLDPVTELAEYLLICGEVVTSIEPTVVEGEQYEFARHEVLPDYGSHQCVMTAVDQDGLESGPSNEVTIEWERVAPKAPTDMVIITE